MFEQSINLMSQTYPDSGILVLLVGGDAGEQAEWMAAHPNLSPNRVLRLSSANANSPALLRGNTLACAVIFETGLLTSESMRSIHNSLLTASLLSHCRVTELIHNAYEII